VPQRFCICTSCTGHGGHQPVFPKSANPGKERCPACQRAADSSRPKTAARGYDSKHNRARERYLAAFAPGQPCAIGGEPLWSKNDLDLAHNESRTGYLGLACQKHNRGHYE
jgi:hypothetical protein